MEQIISDALKIYSPITSVEDVNLLVKTLCDSEEEGLTYRQAIDTKLHAVNQHSAALWKDYFLEHHPRIMELMVKYRAEKRSNHVKKPTYGSTSYSAPPASGPSNRADHSSKSRPLSVSFAVKQEKPDRKSDHKARSKARGRKTSKVRIRTESRSPSRTPSPPARVVANPLGNAYTDEDRAYCEKIIRRRLKQDPTITRNMVAEELGMKAIQHTAQSWAAFIRRQQTLDDLFSVAFLEHRAREAQRKNDKRGKRKCSPSFESSESTSDSSSGSGEDTDSNSGESDEERDRRRMSGPGEGWTNSDRRIVARYIARTEGWDEMTNREKWEPFAELHDARNAKAWAETFRNRKEDPDLKALIRKYRRRREREIRASANSRVAIPSWATGSLKRKPSMSEESASKHHRTG